MDPGAKEASHFFLHELNSPDTNRLSYGKVYGLSRDEGIWPVGQTSPREKLRSMGSVCV